MEKQRIHSFIISLSNPTSYLRSIFKSRAMYLLNNNRNLDTLNNPLDYNCEPYMTMLLNEMFYNYDTFTDVGLEVPSTSLLIKDGLPENIASEIALNIFNVVVDTIVSIIPDIRFGDTQEHFVGFCDYCDVLISVPINKEN